ncbi:sulfotransferase 1B1-like [Haliotis asinina]|uniref:sulfotransferase 1B1-like n=1 Tax=Haliotis asinina TaxID=109174 RepID=UPI00353210CB
MSLVKFPDAGGCSLTMKDVDGRYLTPSGSPDHWYSLRTMKTRSDDVYICSYPKSGFHWIWEIVTMLRSGNSTVIKEVMEGHITDFMPLDHIAKQASPRTLTTHRYPQELQKETFELGCKIVYLVRDPKDICVSYYNHLSQLKPLEYEGQFSDFVPLFLEGKVPFNSWWEHIINWSAMKVKHPERPLLVINYEDMKQDPVTEIKNLADFLEVNVAEHVINEIAQNTKFSAMKAAKEQLDNKLVAYYKCGKEIMYRKGEVGDWKHWLSGSKSQEFDDFINTKLQGSHFSALVSPDRYPFLRTNKFGQL